MGERVKAIRKHLGLTQEEFAYRLQISRSNIATYEAERSNIGEAVIKLICREYGVNETWLRTGEGDMFQTLTREDEIGRFMSDLIRDEGTFKKRLVSAMAKMDVSEWEALERIARKLLEEE